MNAEVWPRNARADAAGSLASKVALVSNSPPDLPVTRFVPNCYVDASSKGPVR
jgi:hypothetical protein